MLVALLSIAGGTFYLMAELLKCELAPLALSGHLSIIKISDVFTSGLNRDVLFPGWIYAVHAAAFVGGGAAVFPVKLCAMIINTVPVSKLQAFICSPRQNSSLSSLRVSSGTRAGLFLILTIAPVLGDLPTGRVCFGS